MRAGGFDLDRRRAVVQMNRRAGREALRRIRERLYLDVSADAPRAGDAPDGDVTVRRLRALASTPSVFGARVALRRRVPARAVLGRGDARGSAASGAVGARRHAAAQTISSVARVPRLTAATRISARMDCATLP